MNDRYMGAMVTLYTLAYHSAHYSEPIFDDFAALSLMSEEECKQIPLNLVAGMRSVTKNDESAEDTLRHIVNTYFSPTVLSSASLGAGLLEEAVKDGILQYVNFGAGYDTFPCRLPGWAAALKVFEIEDSNLLFDKRRRISNAGLVLPLNVCLIPSSADISESPDVLSSNYYFNKKERSFVTAPYLSNGFNKAELSRFLMKLAPYLAPGSRILVEYAKEPMPEAYSDSELCMMLSYYNLRPAKIFDTEEIEERFFAAFNADNPDDNIYPPANVGYCLAVKM